MTVAGVWPLVRGGTVVYASALIVNVPSLVKDTDVLQSPVAETGTPLTRRVVLQ